MKYPTRLKFGTVPICPGAAQAAYIAEAWQDVLMRGHAEHFANGSEGLTWACALSNIAKDPKNKRLFPHSLVEAFFTNKTVCYMFTGEKYKGVFVYIKYAHNYGTQLDLNDAKLSQKQAKETPEIFEQEFLLRVPSKTKKRIHVPNKRASSPRKSLGHRGAVARARAAGLISEEQAQDMAQTMDPYERQRLSSIMSRKV